MTKQQCAVMLAFALMAAGSTLTGCGSSTSSSATVASKQAQVTLAARFPTADGAVKSLLPTGTQAIEVYAMALPYSQGTGQTLIATLTPAAPTASVKMAPGLYMINATAYDSTNAETRTELGGTSTGGEILTGAANTINLTFLDGQWTLNTPIVLSNGTQLNDFVTGGEMYQDYLAATKSAFDYSKPIGGGSGMLRYRFNNNTSARTYGEMMAQFVGTSNSIALFGESYNLTQQCYDCPDVIGDQIIMIEGMPEGGLPTSDSSGYYYQGELLQGNAYELLPGQGEPIFKQNGAVIDFYSKVSAATTDGKTITGNLLEFLLTGKSLSLKTATAAKATKAAKIVKAQSANTTYAGLSVISSEYKLCSPTGGTNKGNWYFGYDTPQQIGNALCYDWGYQMSYQGTSAGDYSYGLVPADPNNLGDYCHIWDYSANTCLQQLPGTGEVYMPYNFYAKKSATKTAIDYGSFKFNFWVEEQSTGTLYVYPFTATGSATVSPAK